MNPNQIFAHYEKPCDLFGNIRRIFYNIFEKLSFQFEMRKHVSTANMTKDFGFWWNILFIIFSMTPLYDFTKIKWTDFTF